MFQKIDDKMGKLLRLVCISLKDIKILFLYNFNTLYYSILLPAALYQQTKFVTAATPKII